MARYYYDKYTNKIVLSNFRNPDTDWEYDGTYEFAEYYDTKHYTEYGFNEYDGFHTKGAPINNRFPPDIIYRAWGTSVEKYEYYRTYEDVWGYPTHVFWRYVKRCQYDENDAPDKFIERVIAEDGTYPNRGKHTDGFFYIKIKLVFPALGLKINGNLKTTEMGWVKVNGTVREIDRIYTKINGVIREVI